MRGKRPFQKERPANFKPVLEVEKDLLTPRQKSAASKFAKDWIEYHGYAETATLLYILNVYNHYPIKEAVRKVGNIHSKLFNFPEVLSYLMANYPIRPSNGEGMTNGYLKETIAPAEEYLAEQIKLACYADGEVKHWENACRMLVELSRSSQV